MEPYRVGAGKEMSSVKWNGVVTMPPSDMERVIAAPQNYIEGWKVSEKDGKLILAPEGNLVVDSGVQASLDRVFAINGPPGAIVRVGVDNGASAPVAGTTQSGANTKTLLTFDSTPTRSSNVVTATRTFTNSNVNFIMKRLFLSRHTADITNSTSADTAGTLHGMTGVFTIDFTALSSWSAVFAATVTGVGA